MMLNMHSHMLDIQKFGFKGTLSHTHCLFLSSSFVCFAIAVNSSIYGNLMNVLCLIVVVFQYTEQYSKLLCDICLEKAKKNYKVFVIEVQKI